MKDLYYLELKSKDQAGQLVPMFVSVFADNDDDAAALLIDSFRDLVREVDFGELKKAFRSKHGFLMTSAQVHTNQNARQS